MNDLIGIQGHDSEEIKVFLRNEIIKITKKEIENITEKSITIAKKNIELTEMVKNKSIKLQNNVAVRYNNGQITICIGEIVDKWWE